MQPLVHTIPYLSPASIVAGLSSACRFVWLDSASTHSCGRYSYLAIDPIEVISSDTHSLDMLTTLSTHLSRLSLTQIPDVPPFQGGVAGFWGYDTAREWLPLRSCQPATALDMPTYQLGIFDCVISFDHVLDKAWVVVAPLGDAQARLSQCLGWLSQSSHKTVNPLPTVQSSVNHTRESYQHMVEEGQRYILDGDIFEVNLALQYLDTYVSEPNLYALYAQLRAKNPAPFSALIHLGQGAILSSSPERLFSLQGRQVEARPIKGTIRRGGSQEEDRALASSLRQSGKDLAENTMIVDLMRNDLSRVCEPGSVKVPQFCGLESYETVHHLVSVVTGQLQPSLTAVDVFKAVFPGGSITGAPKYRAMEIIDTLETVSRGPYCGSAGYFAFNGACDLSILIRTLVLDGCQVSYHAGGAVTLQSDPTQEYEEACLKAQRLNTVVRGL